MPTPQTRFEDIQREISRKREVLDWIHQARMAVRAPYTRPSPMFAAATAPAGHRTFNLLAQGDSWFDYPPGTDMIDCLHANHGHTIVNIAVAGSTLNDEAYGPVPRELFGLPIGLPQSDDPSRIAELVDRITQDKPQALLISAGGNDVAGDEFFSFLNNALSGLPPVNAEVLEGAVSSTFETAYRFMIDHALAAAATAQINMPIFIHGYDYPWPDGRGVIAFLGWKVGPWFDPTFNSKNFPNKDSADINLRHQIISGFIDAVNSMQENLSQIYAGKVFHVDLTRTLLTEDEWANELHPRNPGFAALAAKLDASLQKNIP